MKNETNRPFVEYTNKEIIQILGQRIKKYRLNLNKSQKQIAEQTNLSMPTISNFESGASTGITLLSFIQILRALNLLDQLDNTLPDQTISEYSPLVLMQKDRQKLI